MKDFSDEYKNMITKSLEAQVIQTIGDYGLWFDPIVFSTSLDCGLQSGKTKAAIEYLSKVPGLKMYIANTSDVAKAELAKHGNPHGVIAESRRSIKNAFRGYRVDANQITLVFDDCDWCFSEMRQIAQDAVHSMIGQGTWGVTSTLSAWVCSSKTGTNIRTRH